MKDKQIWPRYFLLVPLAEESRLRWHWKNGNRHRHTSHSLNSALRVLKVPRLALGRGCWSISRGTSSWWSATYRAQWPQEHQRSVHSRETPDKLGQAGHWEMRTRHDGARNADQEENQRSSCPASIYKNWMLSQGHKLLMGLQRPRWIHKKKKRWEWLALRC